MLHKAPAAFGLVSFLLHEGLERARIRRHLLTFAVAAPAMAIITFLFLKSVSQLSPQKNSKIFLIKLQFMFRIYLHFQMNLPDTVCCLVQELFCMLAQFMSYQKYSLGTRIDNLVQLNLLASYWARFYQFYFLLDTIIER